MCRYEVIVGNIGIVYTGDDVSIAEATYNDYLEISESGVGRGGDEDVTFMQDGEPLKEYLAGTYASPEAILGRLISKIGRDVFTDAPECAAVVDAIQTDIIRLRSFMPEIVKAIRSARDGNESVT